jgi:hypothetical protein
VPVPGDGSPLSLAIFSIKSAEIGIMYKQTQSIISFINNSL